MQRTGKTIRTRFMDCVNCRFRAHAKDMAGAAHPVSAMWTCSLGAGTSHKQAGCERRESSTRE